ncbi:MAG: hypothetical protein B6226_03905 [Candidatus Cloacimonetes bacterium 4572_65]|nr:MAG: hypothetical protein B6226_03905 [Candidatus Cloacimonetes bacterium 4572_65]
MSVKNKKKDSGYKVPQVAAKPKSTIKPIQIIEPKLNGIIAFVVFAFTLIMYQLTNAPSLSFWDAGEYSTTVHIFSVLHAPGNPLYILIGRFLDIFRLGMSAPQMASFYSSLLGAFAVMFTYLFTIKLVSMFEKRANIAVLIGIIAAIFTGFSFTFWTNCIEAEVYSGLAFFINLIIYLVLVWVQKSEDMSHQKYLLLITYLFFLGFGFHQTVLQIIPAILLIVVYPLISPHFKKDSFWTKSVLYIIGLFLFYVVTNKMNANFSQPMFAAACAAVLMFFLRDKIGRNAWIIAILLILVGFSNHLYIPIRAFFRPFINEGDPQTWERFWAYFNREQFGGTNISDRNGSFASIQMGHHFFRYFNWQFFNAEIIARFTHMSENIVTTLTMLATYATGIFGVYYHARKNKNSFVYLASLFVMGSIAMVYVMNIPVETPRPRDYFFVTAYNLWTVWMGMGIVYALLKVFKSKKTLPIVVILALVLPTITIVSQYYVHDRSKEYVAAEYGMNFLNSLEENAIIFTNGDNDTFPLWYAQAVDDPYIKANQPDSIAKAEGVINDSATHNRLLAAIAFKDAQCNGIRTDVTIANYSLLNTPWYVRQLRDREGVYFSIPDNQIEAMVTPEAYRGPEKLKIALPNGYRKTFVIEKEDLYMGFWRGQDKATIQIIKDNFGKRPIYFASTVGNQFLGFDDYLETHVLVYKLVPEKVGENGEIRWDKYVHLLENVYTVDSITDKVVYKDDTMARLISPYIQHFEMLAKYYTYIGEDNYAIESYTKALDIYESIEKFAHPGVVRIANRIKQSRLQLMQNR